MLNTPGEDAHDGDLELDFEGLEPDDGPDPDESSAADAPSVDGDDCKPLDDEREQVGYELYSWEAEELDALDEAVHELGLPHEWVSDGYELVVHADDEATIDEILPHFHGTDDDDEDEDEIDVTPIEVVSDLFGAVTKLRRDPTGSGVAEFLDSAEAMGTRPPYGVDEAAWENLVGAVDSLIDGYHAAAGTEVLRNLVQDVFRRVRPLI